MVKYIVKDANMLVFVTPHQFMDGICKRLDGKIRKFSEATIGYRQNKEAAERWSFVQHSLF